MMKTRVILSLLLFIGIGTLVSYAEISTFETKNYGKHLASKSNHPRDTSLVEVKSLVKRSLSESSRPRPYFQFTNLEHIFGVSVPVIVTAIAFMILVQPSVGFSIFCIGFAVLAIAQALYILKLLYNVGALIKASLSGNKGLPKDGCCGLRPLEGKEVIATVEHKEPESGGVIVPGREPSSGNEQSQSCCNLNNQDPHLPLPPSLPEILSLGSSNPQDGVQTVVPVGHPGNVGAGVPSVAG
jgi:hypothetical protein